TLFIEDTNRSQPARMVGAVQFTKMTQRPLPRPIGCAHRFHQRPVGVLLAVLAPMIRAQKHSGLIVSWDGSRDKRAGLHYIAPSRNCRCKHETYAAAQPQNRLNRRSRDELGLTTRQPTSRGGINENRILSQQDWNVAT